MSMADAPSTAWNSAPFFAGAMGAAFAPAPDLLLTGDGRHLAIVGDGGAPYILRERAGDYIRDLLAEASGFDGDPVELGSRPFSACSKDACVAPIPKADLEWRLLATRSSNRIDWSRLTQGVHGGGHRGVRPVAAQGDARRAG